MPSKENVSLESWAKNIQQVNFPILEGGEVFCSEESYFSLIFKNGRYIFNKNRLILLINRQFP